jgi:hypothetical protein
MVKQRNLMNLENIKLNKRRKLKNTIYLILFLGKVKSGKSLEIENKLMVFSDNGERGKRV